MAAISSMNHQAQESLMSRRILSRKSRAARYMPKKRPPSLTEKLVVGRACELTYDSHKSPMKAAHSRLCLTLANRIEKNLLKKS